MKKTVTLILSTAFLGLVCLPTLAASGPDARRTPRATPAPELRPKPARACAKVDRSATLRRGPVHLSRGQKASAEKLERHRRTLAHRLGPPTVARGPMVHHADRFVHRDAHLKKRPNKAEVTKVRQRCRR